MMQSSKIACLGILIFVVLSAIAAMLLVTIGSANPETSRRVATVWGCAVGILIPAIAIWWYSARRKGE